MADAQDLKSWDFKKSCGFESHHRHQVAHRKQLATILQSEFPPFFASRRGLKTDLRLWYEDGRINNVSSVVCDSAKDNKPRPAQCHTNTGITKPYQNKSVSVFGQHGMRNQKQRKHRIGSE